MLLISVGTRQFFHDKRYALFEIEMVKLENGFKKKWKNKRTKEDTRTMNNVLKHGYSAKLHTAKPLRLMRR